jgi:hypothetical protein
MWALMALGLPRCKCEFAVPLYVTCVSETACKQKRTKQKTKVLKTIDLQFHCISRFCIGLPVFFLFYDFCLQAVSKTSFAKAMTALLTENIEVG